MARRGDGIYLWGRTCWLDFTHQGQQHLDEEAILHATAKIELRLT